MKHVLSALAIVAASSTFAFTGVVPNGYDNVEANSTFGMFQTTASRSYMIVIDSSQLTSFVGNNIDGLTMRRNGGAVAWPTTDVTFADFEIYVGASVDPSARSLTFADNYLNGSTQVRDGSLDVLANSWGGTSTPAPFGPMIDFDSGYFYTGGDLAIEMRFTGSGASVAASFDALSTTTQEYGTLVSAAWQATFTPTTGLQGNAIVFQLNGSPVPEPATMIALGAGLAAMAARRRRKA